MPNIGDFLIILHLSSKLKVFVIVHEVHVFLQKTKQKTNTLTHNTLQTKLSVSEESVFYSTKIRQYPINVRKIRVIYIQLLTYQYCLSKRE